MSALSRFRWRTRAMVALTLTILFTLVSASLAFANVTLIQLSSDPYTNTTSYHATEVEPDTYSSGSTIVSTFQAGRFQDFRCWLGHLQQWRHSLDKWLLAGHNRLRNTHWSLCSRH